MVFFPVNQTHRLSRSCKGKIGAASWVERSLFSCLIGIEQLLFLTKFQSPFAIVGKYATRRSGCTCCRDPIFSSIERTLYRGKAASFDGIGCAPAKVAHRKFCDESEGTVIKIPLQITFKNMAPSEGVEAHIRDAAQKLDGFCDDVMGCRVLVEIPHKHHRKGKLYHVRIDVTVPGAEFVIKRAPRLVTDTPTRFRKAPDDVELGESRELSKYAVHDDIQLTIRDAFDAARRKLQDYARRRRGVLKVREGSPHARIAKLFPDEGFGFLETPDGREIYFHENSVLDSDFGGLEIGTEVHFAEEQGEKGPQATTVRPVSHHGR